MKQITSNRLASLGGHLARRYTIVLVLVLLGVVASAMNGQFLTVTNLFNMGQQWSSIGIMAIAMTFVLIGGGFDLSVGGTYACTATLTAALTQQGHPAIEVVVAVLAVGVVVGLANGLLVTKVHVNPLVATLGVGQIVTGFALIYSQGGAYNITGGFFAKVGSGYFGAVPVAFIVMVVLGIFAAFVLARSTYGRSLYATGGNAEASYLSGIRVDAIRITTYVLSGVSAGLAGMVYVGRVSSGQGNIGTGIELTVIAAVLIGGTSIAGGEGAMWRTAAGVALLAILQNFFDQSNVNSFWQYVVQGTVIIVAVAFGSMAKLNFGRTFRRYVRLRQRRIAPEPLMSTSIPLDVSDDFNAQGLVIREPQRL